MKKLLYAALFLSTLCVTSYAGKPVFYYSNWNPVFTSIVTTGGGTIGTWLKVGTTLDVAGPTTFLSSVTVPNLGVTNNASIAQNLLTKYLNVSSTANFAGNGGLTVTDQINTNTLIANGTAQFNGTSLQLTNVASPEIKVIDTTNNNTIVFSVGNTIATVGTVSDHSIDIAQANVSRIRLAADDTIRIDPLGTLANACTWYYDRLDLNNNVNVGKTLSATNVNCTSMTVGGLLTVSSITVNGKVLFTGLGAAGTGTALVISASNEVIPLTSSARFKEDIMNTSLNSDFLYNLQAKDYKRIATGEHEKGWIAEEVYAQCPEIVNLDAEGKPYSINYFYTVYYLVDALQKQDARIKKLEEQMGIK